MGPDEGSARHPALITEAAHSLDDQRRARIRRYSILMGFRIPALILAAWIYSTFHSALGAITVVLVSVPLPWMAVLIANDRPPRRKDEPSRYPRQLREQRALDTQLREISQPHIVDSHSVDLHTADFHTDDLHTDDLHTDDLHTDDLHTADSDPPA
jgi:hypothetical protein